MAEENSQENCEQPNTNNSGNTTPRLDPNNPQVVRPENNMPADKSAKGKFGVDLPPEKKNKKRKTLGSFRSPETKSYEEIYVEALQNQKSQDPIKEVENREKKDADTVGETYDTQGKRYLDIKDPNKRDTKSDSDISVPQNRRFKFGEIDAEVVHRTKNENTIEIGFDRGNKFAETSISNSASKKDGNSVVVPTNQRSTKFDDASIEKNHSQKSSDEVPAQPYSASPKISNEKTYQHNAPVESSKTDENITTPPYTENYKIFNEYTVRVNTPEKIKKNADDINTEIESKEKTEVDTNLTDPGIEKTENEISAEAEPGSLKHEIPTEPTDPGIEKTENEISVIDPQIEKTEVDTNPTDPGIEKTEKVVTEDENPNRATEQNKPAYSNDAEEINTGSITYQGNSTYRVSVLSGSNPNEARNTSVSKVDMSGESVDWNQYASADAADFSNSTTPQSTIHKKDGSESINQHADYSQMSTAYRYGNSVRSGKYDGIKDEYSDLTVYYKDVPERSFIDAPSSSIDTEGSVNTLNRNSMYYTTGGTSYISKTEYTKYDAEQERDVLWTNYQTSGDNSPNDIITNKSPTNVLNISEAAASENKEVDYTSADFWLNQTSKLDGTTETNIVWTNYAVPSPEGENKIYSGFEVRTNLDSASYYSPPGALSEEERNDLEFFVSKTDKEQTYTKKSSTDILSSANIVGTNNILPLRTKADVNYNYSDQDFLLEKEFDTFQSTDNIANITTSEKEKAYRKAEISAYTYNVLENQPEIFSLPESNYNYYEQTQIAGEVPVNAFTAERRENLDSFSIEDISVVNKKDVYTKSNQQQYTDDSLQELEQIQNWSYYVNDDYNEILKRPESDPQNITIQSKTSSYSKDAFVQYSSDRSAGLQIETNFSYYSDENLDGEIADEDYDLLTQRTTFSRNDLIAIKNDASNYPTPPGLDNTVEDDQTNEINLNFTQGSSAPFGENDYTFYNYNEDNIIVSRDITPLEDNTFANQILANTFGATGIGSALTQISNIVNNITDVVDIFNSNTSWSADLNNDYANILRRTATTDVPSIVMSLKQSFDIQGSGAQGQAIEGILDSIGNIDDLVTTSGNIMNHPGAAIANMLRGDGTLRDVFTGGREDNVNLFSQGTYGKQGGLFPFGENRFEDYDINDSFAVGTSYWNVVSSDSVFGFDLNDIGITNQPDRPIYNKDVILEKVKSNINVVNINDLSDSLNITNGAVHKSLISAYQGIYEDVRTENGDFAKSNISYDINDSRQDDITYDVVTRQQAPTGIYYNRIEGRSFPYRKLLFTRKPDSLNAIEGYFPSDDPANLNLRQYIDDEYNNEIQTQLFNNDINFNYLEDSINLFDIEVNYLSNKVSHIKQNAYNEGDAVGNYLYTNNFFTNGRDGDEEIVFSTGNLLNDEDVDENTDPHLIEVNIPGERDNSPGSKMGIRGRFRDFIEANNNDILFIDNLEEELNHEIPNTITNLIKKGELERSKYITTVNDSGMFYGENNEINFYDNYFTRVTNDYLTDNKFNLKSGDEIEGFVDPHLIGYKRNERVRENTTGDEAGFHETKVYNEPTTNFNTLGGKGTFLNVLRDGENYNITLFDSQLDNITNGLGFRDNGDPVLSYISEPDDGNSLSRNDISHFIPRWYSPQGGEGVLWRWYDTTGGNGPGEASQKLLRLGGPKYKLIYAQGIDNDGVGFSLAENTNMKASGGLFSEQSSSGVYTTTFRDIPITEAPLGAIVDKDQKSTHVNYINSFNIGGDGVSTNYPDEGFEEDLFIKNDETGRWEINEFYKEETPSLATPADGEADFGENNKHEETRGPLDSAIGPVVDELKSTLDVISDTNRRAKKKPFAINKFYQKIEGTEQSHDILKGGSIVRNTGTNSNASDSVLEDGNVWSRSNGKNGYETEEEGRSFKHAINKKIHIAFRQSGGFNTTNELNETNDPTGSGFINVYKNYSFNHSDDNILYRIPFQFEAEINGETRQADYATESAVGRTSEFYIWSKTNTRTLQLKTRYIITDGEQKDSQGNLLEKNSFYEWLKDWNESRIMSILNRYRNLLLPMTKDPGNGDYTISPPIFAIMGNSFLFTASKGSNGVFYSRWVAQDVNIDPVYDFGYTNTKAALAYDISMTLKEVFPWADYQSYDSIRASLDI